ncbi:MAG: hypothetical protein K2X03_24865 [Bryobacteraceae bacterium]|nr:hypothetical protein [Bryobacteraceae bacterium]
MIWIALTLVVLGMIAYRYFVSRQEDDTVHLADSEAPLIAEQQHMVARLNKLDLWKRRLTVADVVLGAGLATVFVVNALRGSGLL